MPSTSAEAARRGPGAGLAAALLRSAVRIALKPALSPRIPIPWQRRWLRLVARLNPPVSGVDIGPATVGGVTGEWLRTPAGGGNAHRRAVTLYLHGGGYCVGSPVTHRAIT